MPTVVLQGGQEVRSSLSDNRGDGTRFDREPEFGPLGVADPDAIRQRAGQVPADQVGQRLFPAATVVPPRNGGVGGKNAGQRLR